MVIETIFSAIGILPIFGGITSSVLRMYERPEVECNEVTYTAEENGDIQINATFTATTRYGNPLPITGTICNIRYDFTTEHFIHVRGIVCGEPVKFKPVNIEGGGACFSIRYMLYNSRKTVRIYYPGISLYESNTKENLYVGT